jgi:hypothetical protein
MVVDPYPHWSVTSRILDTVLGQQLPSDSRVQLTVVRRHDQEFPPNDLPRHLAAPRPLYCREETSHFLSMDNKGTSTLSIAHSRSVSHDVSQLDCPSPWTSQSLTRCVRRGHHDSDEEKEGLEARGAPPLKPDSRGSRDQRAP